MLDKIIDYKKLELEHVRRKISLRDMKKRAQDTESAVGFFSKFDAGINVIAEAKKASPSAGIIREDFDVVGIALSYAENGAKAISVLTDEKFFQGSLENLIKVRKRFSQGGVNTVPLLRKDFTLDEYHVFEARAAGADAVLLIVAALDRFQLNDYCQLVKELGMTALVEIHDAEELETALNVGAKDIGVNNRDLKTFKTDVEVTKKMLKDLENFLTATPQTRNEFRLISESGLKSRETVTDLKKEGADGFLIGESFMRAKDPGLELKSWLNG